VRVSRTIVTTMPTRRAYIYPARPYASTKTDSSLPPMGLRVRLTASVDLSGFSQVDRAILQALKRSYLQGTSRRLFQVPVNGRFVTKAVSTDTIIAVNGTNPPNVHGFTPAVTGPLRIVVDITPRQGLPSTRRDHSDPPIAHRALRCSRTRDTQVSSYPT
jgi:hypothetical protein